IFPKKIVFTFSETKRRKQERVRKRYVIFGLESRTNNGFEELKPVELKSKPRLLRCRRQVCSFFVFLQRSHGLTAAGRSGVDFRAVADVRRSGDFLAHHLSAHGVESTEH
ncbi:unnamed protein product, partial [Brassica rapa subsp. trilocularis]